ncbi:thermonuclease family protein [Mannheimia sp. AT1]|uniref:Thermonuclease family protein n=1 Tax=Mannheimia cairinae TaxID=3025936 RepID=A0ABT5MRX4_9PAST|nr:thermonuclease family protein [Mannheimia cairinae]MDD0823627.1 thermonuclease family protein [Mannheimia cairinae]MDD0825441.1 thermonuclease family protein [Mannheimia cairinae]
MKYIYSLIITFLFCLNSVASERQIQCKVVSISDGDTLTCLFDRKQIKVRLLHIDAPESSQPYGNRAKQALANQVFKQNVMLKSTGYDRYQRLLAEVYNDKGENINLKLVQQGMAWAYTRTAKHYEQAQKHAQQARIGLWRDNSPIPPSEWRKHNGVSSTQAVKNRESFANSSRHINCQRKLSCQQIGSYELALRYFRQCGWKELDGNNDGIPCNKLIAKHSKIGNNYA